jgi:predicted SnoaL-like aldol condensation-catalyzing enzyme
VAVKIRLVAVQEFTSWYHQKGTLGNPTIALMREPDNDTYIKDKRVKMDDSKAENNKAIVLEGFDTLFNKRDYAAAKRFWSPNYIQHSAHIEPGRDGLFNLIKSLPSTLRYEPGVIVAEGDFVIIHGRFSGFGLPVNWIAADIIRMKDGILIEHWDVIQDEATKEQSKSGNPMFGDSFPDRA